MPDNKLFINDPHEIIPQMIDGFLAAFGGDFKKTEKYNGIVKRKQEKRVSVVTGGGSGGEPLFIGFVGEGLADGAAIGNIAAAPPGTAVEAVCREVYNREGVMLIAGNHTGDIMNFELAAELLSLNTDIKCEILYVTDDMGSSGDPRSPANQGTDRSKRCSSAGTGIIVQIAAAAAANGYNLAEVKTAAQKANGNMSTLSAVMEPGINLVTGLPLGSIAADEILIGTGVTGEPGLGSVKMCGAKEITEILIGYLCDDLAFKKGDEAAVYINGCGAVTVTEELIVCGHACSALTDRGISIYDVDLTERLRVGKTNAIYITLLKLDEELKKLASHPSYSPLIHHRHYKPGIRSE